MEISVGEALELLQTVGLNVREARARAEALEDVRDALIRQFDGQPGMLRREMAAALGITKQRLLVIANQAKPEREALADGVPMDPMLYAALVEVVGQFARTLREADEVRLDVKVA